MPQEKLNWDTSAVFLDNRYHTKETWQDKDGKPLHPQQAYFVGGQTKVYGAAMFRMRAEDFGVSSTRGASLPRGPSPTPIWSRFIAAPKSFFTSTATWARRPRFQAVTAPLLIPRSRFTPPSIPIPRSPTNRACRPSRTTCASSASIPFPFRLVSSATKLNPLASKCVRCDTCDGYPCLVHAKSDADINCIRQIMHLPNVTLMTNSRVTRLLTNSSGTAVTAVEVIHTGHRTLLPKTVTLQPIAPGSLPCARAPSTPR